jgi:hypothetical protein
MINARLKLSALFTTIAMLARATYERCQAGAEEIERRALSRSRNLSAAQPSCTSHGRSSSGAPAPGCPPRAATAHRLNAAPTR